MRNFNIESKKYLEWKKEELAKEAAFFLNKSVLYKAQGHYVLGFMCHFLWLSIEKDIHEVDKQLLALRKI